MMREEIDKNRSIIFNGQQQVTEMENFIRDLEAIKLAL
jgi:hypothetical protein